MCAQRLLLCFVFADSFFVLFISFCLFIDVTIVYHRILCVWRVRVTRWDPVKSGIFWYSSRAL
jgi:hypothetical protein